AANEGVGSVTVELLRGADPEVVSADVKTEVDSIQSFPEDSEEPTVTVASRRSEVISLVIAGDQPLSTLHDIAEKARSDLLRSESITQIELQGVRPLEVSIEVPRENLEAYGLNLDVVAAQVREASLELPGGGLDTSSGEILVRVSDRRLTKSGFENIIIRGQGIGDVRLGDIATITDGYADTDQEAYYNGKRAVRVTAYRVGDEKPTVIADTVKDYLEELRGQVPGTIQLAVWNDESKLLRERIDLLVRNARSGLILVLIVLALFLKPRLAGWVSLGIPISFFGAFLLFEPFTLSINMITLFGLIVTLGMVVDDAIIVGENIYTKTQEGLPHREAAITGAQEMATPVTFSILTTIAAFGPLLFVPGAIGKIFRIIPLVVIAVLIFSLLESFFVLPAHLSHAGSSRIAKLLSPIERIQIPVSAWLERFTANIYRPIVEFCIRIRYVAVGTAFSVLIVTGGLVASGVVPFSFLPKLEGDLVLTTARLPYGSPLSQTLEVQASIEEALERAIEELGEPDTVIGVFTRVGEGQQARGPSAGDTASGSHLVTVEVSLVSSTDRSYSAQDLGDAWSNALPTIPGVEALSVKSNLGGPGGDAVDIQLSHTDTEILAQASAEVTQTLRGYSGLINVENGYAAGKPQLDYHLLPEARSLGVTANDVARQLRSAFFGSEALREQRGRNEVKVYARLPENQRRSEADLEQLLVRTPDGGFTPLGTVARFDRGRAPTVIRREDGQRVVNVKADLGPGVASPREILESVQSTTFPKLLKDFPGLELNLVGEQRDQSETFSSLGRNFLLATVVIFTLLAIPFRSYVQPVIVMSAIPFGMVGAVGGHMLMGYGLSVISMFGVIALSGVVVNDSLVLVSASNNYRSRGQLAHEAIVAAGMRRLRPILLTSLTTFFGLAPMIAETSVQARFLIPMAISLGFGVLFATIIVLLIVPALYMIVDDIEVLAARLFGAHGGSEPLQGAAAAREP
ncbi:MAG: efflux RND transporter permease subunit, partial [Myxococcota bacterium]